MDRATLTMLLMAFTVLPPHASGPLQRAPLEARTTPERAAPAAAHVELPAAALASAPRAHIRFPVSATPLAVRQLADDILAADDNARRPFVVIDKRAARIFVIDADGRLLGQAPVLLGAARGDDSVPGIGARAIAAIRPFERTTPAGRFVATAGRNANDEDIVWVDYDAAISMHRVRPVNPRERRLQRLASASAADNRISYGCINMPRAFFDEVVGTLFARGLHTVYILPDVKTVREAFGTFDSLARVREKTACCASRANNAA